MVNVLLGTAVVDVLAVVVAAMAVVTKKIKIYNALPFYEIFSKKLVRTMVLIRDKFLRDNVTVRQEKFVALALKFVQVQALLLGHFN